MSCRGGDQTTRDVWRYLIEVEVEVREIFDIPYKARPTGIYSWRDDQVEQPICLKMMRYRNSVEIWLRIDREWCI